MIREFSHKILLNINDSFNLFSTIWLRSCFCFCISWHNQVKQKRERHEDLKISNTTRAFWERLLLGCLKKSKEDPSHIHISNSSYLLNFLVRYFLNSSSNLNCQIKWNNGKLTLGIQENVPIWHVVEIQLLKSKSCFSFGP